MQLSYRLLIAGLILQLANSSPIRQKRGGIEDYVHQINELRRKLASNLEIVNMKTMVLDDNLVVKAAEQSCDSLEHGSDYRYFLSNGDVTTQEYDRKKDEEFYDLAHTSLDLAIQERGKSMGELEVLVPSQSKIGCAALTCTTEGRTYSVVCLVGDKGSISSADYQFPGGLRDGFSSHQLVRFITHINQHRATFARTYHLPTPALVHDKQLAEQAAKHECTFDAGPNYRVFWAPGGDRAKSFMEGVSKKFWEDAVRSSVQQAMNNAGTYLGLADAMVPSQTKIGCAIKKCVWQGYEHVAICLIGPKGTLTPDDLPIGRG